MHKIILTVAILAVPLFAAAPAFAMKGIDAARSCEAQRHRCITSYGDDGSVILIVDGGETIIDCPSATSDCHVVREVPKPRAHADVMSDTPASLSTMGGGHRDDDGGTGGGKGHHDAVGSFATTLSTGDKSSGPIVQ